MSPSSEAAHAIPASVEAWCRAYVASMDLAHKLAPPAPPAQWAAAPPAPERLLPGRPPELTVATKSERSIPRQKLALPRWRARLFHTFLHHELQAAELMAWAILAFPETPRAFRAGLLGICCDELRHMRLYRRYLDDLGHSFGDFPVRDWFWQRLPQCRTPLEYVALMGMGLEGGNLDHTDRYARWLEAVGDEEGARIQRLVHEEEIPHVRFAVRWFERWTGGVDFDTWARELVPPLTPALFRGRHVHRASRLRAGLDGAFVDALENAR